MSYVDPFAFEEKNSEVEIFYNGDSTGLIVEVRPKFSDEVQAYEKKLTRELTAGMKKNRGKLDFDVERVEKSNIDRVVAHVAGWRWVPDCPGIGGKKAKFSEENLRAFLGHKRLGPEIQRQVLAEAEEDANFLEKSASNSESA